LARSFSQQLDVYVRDSWLPRQTAELQALLAERATQLGPRQARPFKTGGYTDDSQIDELHIIRLPPRAPGTVFVSITPR
jgi:hypothetical protein